MTQTRLGRTIKYNEKRTPGSSRRKKKKASNPSQNSRQDLKGKRSIPTIPIAPLRNLETEDKKEKAEVEDEGVGEHMPCSASVFIILRFWFSSFWPSSWVLCLNRPEAQACIWSIASRSIVVYSIIGAELKRCVSIKYEGTKCKYMRLHTFVDRHISSKLRPKRCNNVGLRIKW